MAVAARAMANGNEALWAEARRLAALLGRPMRVELEHRALQTELINLNRLLVARIREGEFDSGAAREQLFNHLYQVTLDKLAESNPKYFDQGR